MYEIKFSLYTNAVVSSLSLCLFTCPTHLTIEFVMYMYTLLIKLRHHLITLESCMSQRSTAHDLHNIIFLILNIDPQYCLEKCMVLQTILECKCWQLNNYPIRILTVSLSQILKKPQNAYFICARIFTLTNSSITFLYRKFHNYQWITLGFRSHLIRRIVQQNPLLITGVLCGANICKIIINIILQNKDIAAYN